MLFAKMRPLTAGSEVRAPPLVQPGEKRRTGGNYNLRMYLWHIR